MTTQLSTISLDTGYLSPKLSDSIDGQIPSGGVPKADISSPLSDSILYATQFWHDHLISARWTDALLISVLEFLQSGDTAKRWMATLTNYGVYTGVDSLLTFVYVSRPGFRSRYNH